MAPIESEEPALAKHEKKSKKDKSSKPEKKRAREDDAAADSEPKHKKTKSVSIPATTHDEPGGINGDAVADKKKKKKDKKSKTEEDDAAVDGAKAEKKHKKKHSENPPAESNPEAEVLAEDGELKKKKKKKKDADTAEDGADAATTEKKSKKASREVVPEPTDEDAADADAMEVDQPADSQPSQNSSTVYQPPDIPANPQFPFYSQTVSLYEPLYPQGWAQPVTSAQSQHLRPLRNSYVPSLRGVLMDYKNVSVGEHPGREGAANDDDQPAMLSSKDEFAVGFGWITADVELFVPSRGAWMEGSVNLQTEGHIGVVCFGKFNASVEARRLPPDWKWVPNESPEAQGFEETASVITADDHGVVRQIHSTGFWADGTGRKVTGRIRFRIRNFDVGTSGETSYLSLEGTMLDKQGEKRLVAEEAETARLRKAKKSGQRREKRRAPEFAMTRFSAEGGEQAQENADETNQPMQWTTSRAASES